MGLRNWAIVIGALVAFGGLILLHFAGGPMILIFGVLIVVTAAFERNYGRAGDQPGGPGWPQTNERFIDPGTGKLVTVWFETQTGERRYVEEKEGVPPAT